MKMRWIPALALLVAVACSSAPKEDVAGFRAAEEQLIGHPITNETAFQHLVAVDRGICKSNKNTFAFTRAIAQENGTSAGLELAIRYLCPQRLNEK